MVKERAVNEEQAGPKQEEKEKKRNKKRKEYRNYPVNDNPFHFFFFKILVDVKNHNFEAVDQSDLKFSLSDG